MQDLSILIKALLDPNSTKDIESQIKNLQNIFEKSPLKLKVDVDNAEFKKFSENLKSMSASMSKALHINADTSGLDKLSITTDKTTAGLEHMTEKIREMTNAQGQSIKEITLFKQEVDALGVAHTVTSKKTEKVTDDYKKQRDELTKLTNSLEQYKLKMLGGEGFKGELDIFAQKQKGRYDKSALESIRQQVKDLNVDTPNLENNMKKLNIQLSSLKQQAAQSGNALTRAFENAYKFLRFYLVGGLLVGAVNFLKGSVDTIRELDTAITDLKKVSDEIGTSVGVREFLQETNALAIEVGHSTKAAIESITGFKKLGYTLKEAQDMAGTALIYSNVGDLSIGDATQSLISIMKAFNIEAKDSISVVDKLNEVGKIYCPAA